MLFEEFLLCQDQLKVKVELVLFPSTRFAYLFLMIHRVWLNISVLRLVAESPTYSIVKAATKKRGEEGKRALEEFRRFESLVESREFKVRLLGGASVMEPFSMVLHYGVGDSVPLSHVLPCFQLLYDFSQQMDEFEAITDFLDSEEERDEVSECVRDRWLGEGRRVGLKADVHLLAFVLDPFVHAALTSPQKPDCPFLDGTVLEGARGALRHFASDDHAKRAVLLQQFMLWNAAAPRLPGEGHDGSGEGHDSQPLAQETGNNAFSALRLSAMDQVWSKIQSREAKMEEDKTPRDRDSAAFAMREEIAKLRLCDNPVEFWLAMMNETPRGATAEQKQAHMLFCKSASDISSIIGHTCGVERAGKAYKQVLTSMRKSMDETRAMKAVYVYSNYNLRRLKQSAGDAFFAFDSVASERADGAEGEKDSLQEQVEKHTLRRGNLIFHDVTEEGEEELSEEEAGEVVGEGEEGEEGAGGAHVTEVKWSVPEGFKVADEPAKLDSSLVGEYVYLRWEMYGWQLGKIAGVITKSTPQLFKKFNYRIAWADGSKGPSKLAVESYAQGSDARYNSWVILKRL